MTSKMLAQETGCTPQWVQYLTKQARERGESFITLQGTRFFFALERDGHGVAYRYSEAKAPSAPKQKRASLSKIDISGLPEINIDKPTKAEKKELITFYKRSKTSLRAIATAYNIVFNNKYNLMSLERKLRRWIDGFSKEGMRALEDKRGGNRVSSVNHEMFLKSLVKNANMLTYFSRYCFFWNEENGKIHDIYNPTSNISYSAFKAYFNKHKKDLEVLALLRGKDFLDDMLPTFNGAKYIDYPNEQWQIDATKIDIMAKVPVFDGEVDYFSNCPSDEYRLERFTLIGIVDMFSGARVYELFTKMNSYSDARLLRKAITHLGMPEVIKGDNGKDYVSNHFQNVLEHLGIAYWAATPYKGAEKGKIERGFRTLQHNHLFENLAGFTGHSVAQKQIIENQASKKSQRKGRPTELKEEMMWWWDLGKSIDGIINHMFKKEFACHNVKIEHDANLDKKLGKRKYHKVHKQGIALNKTYYKSVELWSKAKLGDKVLVIEDIDDLDKAYALIDGEFIELLSDKKFESTPELAKEVKRTYKKRVNKTIKDIAKSGEDGLAKLQKLHKIKHTANDGFIRANQEEKKTKPSKLAPISPAPSKTNDEDVDFLKFIRSVS